MATPKDPVRSIVVVPLVPGFDRSVGTITWVKTSLYVTAVSILACWAVGIWAHITGVSHLIVVFEGSEFTREAILFAVSLIVTFINDALGYVHTIALRWALYGEGRLEYNTNFRLFSSARTSFANRWYMNILSVAMLTLSYTCASLLLVSTQIVGNDGQGWGDDIREGFGVNAMAMMLLGFALCVQLVSALLCMRQHDTQIPT